MASKFPIEVPQIEKAVDALLKHVALKRNQESEKKGTKALFEEDDFILAVIGLKNVPDRSKTKPLRFEIPHSLYPEAPEICIFVKDPKADAKKLLEEKGVKAKVITLDKLRKDYTTFEAKRKLSSSYDIFFCDDRIVPLLPKLLGRSFFTKKRQPIRVSFQPQLVAKEINQAIASSYLFLGGACVTPRIARTKFTSEQVTQNIVQGLTNCVELIPKKWKNIQSVYIKTSDSVALPIYNKLPEAVVRLGANEDHEVEEEELEEITENNKRKKASTPAANPPKKAKGANSAPATPSGNAPSKKDKAATPAPKTPTEAPSKKSKAATPAPKTPTESAPAPSKKAKATPAPKTPESNGAAKRPATPTESENAPAKKAKATPAPKTPSEGESAPSKKAKATPAPKTPTEAPSKKSKAATPAPTTPTESESAPAKKGRATPAPKTPTESAAPSKKSKAATPPTPKDEAPAKKAKVETPATTPRKVAKSTPKKK